MTKTERLKMAYNDLKAGKIIEFQSDKGKYYNCKCWISNSKNPNCKKRFIFWKCFGQSANRMSINDLRWIAKTIAHCTTYEYTVTNNIY